MLLGIGMLIVVLCAFSQAVLADSVTDRLLKQDIDRRDQERRDRRWEELHTPSAPAPSPSAPAPSDSTATLLGPCFPIRTIHVQPDDVLNARAVQRITRAWVGRCLRASDLVAIQEALNGQALAQGLVTTRVVIPEQNLSSGLLQLQVWPGRVAGQRAPAIMAMELAFASPVKTGEYLQLRALEQAVDNLNRLASFQASAVLSPGEELGSSVIDFQVKRQAPWQAGAAWQAEALNTDQPSHQLRANFTLDSPLKLVDRLVLGVNANLQEWQVDDTNGVSVDYDLPFGWWRFSTGVDRFRYHHQMYAGVTPFSATGDSRSGRMELQRSLFRDQKRRFTMALHYKQRIADNFINRVKVGVSSYRVESAGLRADFSQVSAPWVWDISADIEQGEAHSSAQPAPFSDDYWRQTLSTRLHYQWARLGLSASANVQWSGQTLPVSEQFSLSGYVAGYSPVSVTANEGVAARLEAAYPMQWTAMGLRQIKPALALNWAHSKALAGGEPATSLQACSTSVVLQWPRAVAQASIALPFHQRAIAAADRWQLDAGLSVQW